MDPNTAPNPNQPPPETPLQSADPAMPLPAAGQVIAPSTVPAAQPEPSDPPSAPPAPAAAMPSAATAEPASPTESDPAMPLPAAVSQPPQTPNQPPEQSKRKKRLLAVSVIVLVILLAGGYVFGLYLPNQPGNVFKTSLSRTATGYDKLVSYVGDQQAKHYTGGQLNGSLSITSGSASGEGTFSGQNDGGNAQGTLSLDIAGQKFNANIRAIEPKGQKTPDLYLQLNGIKTELDSLGLNSLDTLDGKWISIDHTLIDGLANTEDGNAGSSTSFTPPTSAQLQDALQRLGTVNRQYLFSTGSTAVLQNRKYLGKSMLDGRSVYGYQVAYDKANTKAYVQAVVRAMNASQLNTWAKQIDGGRSISDAADLSSIDKSIDSSSNQTFTMYVDAQTKLIRQVHIADTDKSDPGGYLNLNIDYTGGSQYPFSMEVHGKDGGETDTIMLGASLNSATNTSTLTFDFEDSGSSSPTKVSGNLSITPSNKPLTVTAPAGAEPVTNVLQSLGLDNGIN